MTISQPYDVGEVKIVRFDIELLRTKSKPLDGPLPMWYIDYISELCKANDGYYLAGIQLGDARRFCVPFNIFTESDHYDRDGNLIGLPLMYNPEILSVEGRIVVEEGCLSFPGVSAHVARSLVVELQYRDQDWNLMHVVAGHSPGYLNSWVLAHAIQHEVAHLDGGLFFDSARLKDKKAVLARCSSEMRKLKATGRIPALISGPVSVRQATNGGYP
jgi:peptide deformylase